MKILLLLIFMAFLIHKNSALALSTQVNILN